MSQLSDGKVSIKWNANGEGVTTLQIIYNGEMSFTLSRCCLDPWEIPKLRKSFTSGHDPSAAAECELADQLRLLAAVTH